MKCDLGELRELLPELERRAGPESDPGTSKTWNSCASCETVRGAGARGPVFHLGPVPGGVPVGVGESRNHENRPG